MLYLLIAAATATAGEFEGTLPVVLPSNEPLATLSGVAEVFPGHEDVTVDSSVPYLSCSIRNGAVYVSFHAGTSCVLPARAVCEYEGNTLILNLEPTTTPIGQYDRWDIVNGLGVNLRVFPQTLALYSYELPEGTYQVGPGDMLTASGLPWEGMACSVRAWPDGRYTLDVEVSPGAQAGTGTCNDIPVTLSYE